MTRPIQFLFAYGTLRQAEPESVEHGPAAVSAISAKVVGRLYALPEGYPILLVDSGDRLAAASHDWAADWERACRRLGERRTAFPRAPTVEGELIEIPLGPTAFRTADQWEGFSVGKPSVYQRFAIPALDERGNTVPAWAYGCTSCPPGASPYPGPRWIRPASP